MEIKLNEPIKETECVVYERMSGMAYRTTVEKILRLQKELNDQLLSANHEVMTLREIYEVITRDWPEEERIEFFERFDNCGGWPLVTPKNDKLMLALDKTKTEDGTILIGTTLILFDSTEK